MHAISFAPGRWTWNNDADRPTFNPSVLLQGGHYAPGWKGPDCWCTWYPKNDPDALHKFKCERCHSFVRDGKIQFLSDSTHALAGQTVDLPEWTEYLPPEFTHSPQELSMYNVAVTLTKSASQLPVGATFDHTALTVKDAAGALQSFKLNGSESTPWSVHIAGLADGPSEYSAQDTDASGAAIGPAVTATFTPATFQATSGISVTQL